MAAVVALTRIFSDYYYNDFHTLAYLAAACSHLGDFRCTIDAYYEAVEDRLVAPESWAESSDRDFRIQGRPSRAYHENAIRWMTHEVAGERHRRRGWPGLPARLRSQLGSLRGRFGMWRHRHGREA